MKIARDPRYVHGGFEAQSTGKVAFNRVLRFWSAPTRGKYVANECRARDGKAGLNPPNFAARTGSNCISTAELRIFQRVFGRRLRMASQVGLYR